MKKGTSKPLTSAQQAELQALAASPGGSINTQHLPEQKDWRGPRRGAFFRPFKRQLTLRLDADLVDWFKSRAPNGEGYQTSINTALREYIVERGGANTHRLAEPTQKQKRM